MMVDTNIVIDLREEGSRWFDWSFEKVANSLRGSLSTSVVVLGELASRSGTAVEIEAMLAGFGIRSLPLDAAGSVCAGLAHRAYLKAGGSRQKLLADFLIGGHAMTAGLPLLTRDAKPFRRYFPDLPLITPETHP